MKKLKHLSLASLWYNSQINGLHKIPACDWDLELKWGTVRFNFIHNLKTGNVERRHFPTCPKCLVTLDTFLADPWPIHQPVFDLSNGVLTAEGLKAAMAHAAHASHYQDRLIVSPRMFAILKDLGPY